MTAGLPGDRPEDASELGRIDWEAQERVELSMPVRPEPWALARLTVSTIASRLDFGYEDVEDLRLAIDELCTSCAAGSGPASRLRLCFESDPDSLRVECVVDHVSERVEVAADEEALGDASLGGITVGELSRMILAELVDRYSVGPAVSGERRGYLEKRRPPATA
jgi:hypothetical protein